MSLPVRSPCPGSVVAMDRVPDPVFAGGMVGPGAAIEPAHGETTVVSPVAGRLLKVHPHAFVVMTEGGVGVLVHLGIDTVRLEGEGFEVLTSEKSVVAAGDPVVRWDPAAVAAKGLSAVVPVVVMEASADAVRVVAEGDVAPGDLLIEVG